jgi:hypothetical protein
VHGLLIDHRPSGATPLRRDADRDCVLGVVVASDLTSPTGSTPIGTTLFTGVVGGVIWATFFFILAYVPLALIAIVRARRR